MRFVLLLVALTVVFTIGGCATQDTTTDAAIPSENEGVAGAGSGPSRLNEHGGIAW